jgi:colanic acid/amylovoran biosynthesis glycosyltransferase
VTADVARLGLGAQVRMLGNVPHAELVRRLAAGEYDVFALASTERPGEHEGIPVAVMEAMAAGLPVVATATGSLDELVGPEHGMLVPQRDPPALAGALARLLSDPVARERMGRAARDKIRADFETEATTRTLLGFLTGAAS